MRGYNYKKAAQLINYFAVKKGGSINKMKSFKLIWLVNRLHLRKYARTVTGDNHFAMIHGPVPSNTKDCIENTFAANPVQKSYFNEYLELRGNNIISKVSVNTKVFSESDLEVIDTILANYGKYDQFELREISHEYPEWKKFEEKIKKTGSSFKMDLEDFFQNGKDGHDLFLEESEDLQIIKDEFLETASC